MYQFLKQQNNKPPLYCAYTADALWTDEYRSAQMLNYHLNDAIDVSSHRHSYIDDAVAFMVREFSLDTSKSMIDFGCGPGLYTNRLAHYTNVSGIDFSSRSIEYAKQSAQNMNVTVDYILGNYLNTSFTQRFDLITMVMYDICALSTTQRRELFLTFKSLLNENGKLFFDVYSHVAYENRTETAYYEHLQLHNFWSANDYYAFVNTFKYDAKKVMLDKYTIIEESTSYDVFNWLKYYSLQELEAELKEIGLHVEAVYGDMTGKTFDKQAETFAVVVSIA